MTNNELNVIKIMTAIINMSQSIVYGAKDISIVNWVYEGIVYDSNNENKIVASYIPESQTVLEYWEDLFDMSCRFVKDVYDREYIQICFISEENEEFDIRIDSTGKIS